MPRKINLALTVNDAVKLLKVEDSFRGHVPESESGQRKLVKYFYDRLRVGKGNDFVSVEEAKKERIYHVAGSFVNKAYKYIHSLSDFDKELLRRVGDAMEGKDSIDSICIAAENVQLEPRVEYALKKAISIWYGRPAADLNDAPF